jgi:hypothetical protein
MSAPQVVQVEIYQLGLALQIMEAFRRTMDAAQADRTIELRALEALIEIHEAAARARRELGLVERGVALRVVFEIARPETMPAEPIVPLEPSLRELLRAPAANRLPI